MGTQQPQRLDAGNDEILAHSYSEQGQALILLHNLSRHSLNSKLKLPGKGKTRDLLEDDDVEMNGSVVSLRMPPYDYSWLARAV